MKSLTYTLFALLLSANIYAVEIPNQFEDGQVTSASQMNENFQALKAELEAQRALIEANLGNQKVVFQGFSAESMDGGQGLLAMQQACHNFVSGSHICNTTEFSESPYNPSAVETMSGHAWVLSDIVDGSDILNINKRGVELFYNSHVTLSCQGWGNNTQNTAYRGTMITQDGGIGHENCSTAIKVACCK